tara:strand:- start:190 stop:774 length:585 start_codon:yes stop_codon:yes gene_type:complete
MATIINGSTGASQIQDNTVSNAKVVDDAVGIAELSATGTASSSTFLRGDNAWAAPGGGGLTQLASAATTSGTSIVFSGLNLSTYKFLYICQNGVGWAADTAGIQRLTPNGGSFVRWAGGGSAVPGYYGLTFVDLSTGIGSGTTVSATPAAIIHVTGAFTTFVNTGISASTTSLTFGTDGNVAFNKGNIKLYGLK